MSAPCCQCKRHCKKVERAKVETCMAVIAASWNNVVGLQGIGRLSCHPQLRDCFLLYADRELHMTLPLVLGLRYISKLDAAGPTSTASSSLLCARTQTDLHYFRLGAQR